MSSQDEQERYQPLLSAAFKNGIFTKHSHLVFPESSMFADAAVKITSWNSSLTHKRWSPPVPEVCQSFTPIHSRVHIRKDETVSVPKKLMGESKQMDMETLQMFQETPPQPWQKSEALEEHNEEVGGRREGERTWKLNRLYWSGPVHWMAQSSPRKLMPWRCP